MRMFTVENHWPHLSDKVFMIKEIHRCLVFRKKDLYLVITQKLTKLYMKSTALFVKSIVLFMKSIALFVKSIVLFMKSTLKVKSNTEKQQNQLIQHRSLI